MRLHADDVTVRIDDRNILDSVTVCAEPGRVLGLLGPNGSGKTTLLTVMAGLRRPTAGRVVMDDCDVASLSDRDRARRIAVVEQHPSTTLGLTARDVAALGRLPHRSRWTAHDPDGDAIVDRALADVDATAYADAPWATLSGGERQRVHLARALAQQPSVLLLDEPSNHLDLAHQLRFLELVRRLQISTVIALHDLNLAAAYCDDLAVLQDGRLVRSGTARDVLDQPTIAEVYRVDADVEAHPRRAGSHVRWNAPITEAMS